MQVDYPAGVIVKNEQQGNSYEKDTGYDSLSQVEYLGRKSKKILY